MNTFRVSSGTIDTNAKERFVQHAAGLDGRGGSSYIDSMILSDRESTNDWDAAAETMVGRFYYLQNWRADMRREVLRMLEPSGKQVVGFSTGR